MNSSTRLGLLFAVQLTAGAAFLACGGDDGKDTGGDDGNGSPAGETGTLKVQFNPMFSAFDGEHTFQLPVKVDGKTGAKWKVSDPTKVDIAETSEGATLTMRAAGTVKVTATIGSESGTADLTITQATPEQWKAGSERYNNGIIAFKGDGGTPPAGGSLANYIDFKGGCTTCHGATATTLKVEHTPLQTGGYSDEQLLTIITTGVKPEGVKQRSGIPAFFWGMGHRWELTDAERTGIVVYLRSLAPKSQDGFDFPVIVTDAGVFQRDGAPITRPRRDGGDATAPTTPDDAATAEADADTAEVDAGASADDAATVDAGAVEADAGT